MEDDRRISQLFAGCRLTHHEISRILQTQGLIHRLTWVKAQAIKQPGLILKAPGTYMCQRCQNQRASDFACLPDEAQTPYCLCCLNMGRISLADNLYSWPQWVDAANLRLGTSYLTWQGVLSSEQDRVAQELINHLTDSRPHLVYAVTGAGKTEMLFPVIDKILSKGQRVCLASPRIDVIEELYPRISSAFAGITPCMLHGRQTETRIASPLVLATSHQLLRFNAAFDLLIVDEVDAFPYVGNDLLHKAANQALKKNGKLIYLTATPDDKLKQAMAQGQLRVSLLPARFHGHPLPVPRLVWLGDWQRAIVKRSKYSALWRTIRRFTQLNGIKIIFMPDIKLALDLYAWIKTSQPVLKCEVVYASDPQRLQKVSAVRSGQVDLLISSTILERGVTFVNCQVLIIGAEHRQFTSSALVQMSGRVGRSATFPKGVVWFGCYGRSKAIVDALKQIQQMNHSAKQRGLLTDAK